jgi:hypothetical protein
MGEIFQEFAEDGTPLLSKAQSERFVELLKKKSVLLPETKFLCMKCGEEMAKVGEDENGDAIHEPCDCGLPEPEGTLRFI